MAWCLYPSPTQTDIRPTLTYDPFRLGNVSDDKFFRIKETKSFLSSF